MEQTAVDYLISEMINYQQLVFGQTVMPVDSVIKAQEMFKAQIEKAYSAQKIGLFAMTGTGIIDTANKTAEQYFNETFDTLI